MSLDAPAATRRAAAIHALLTAPTIAAAAARIGVNEKTVDRWLADADFAAAVRAAQRRVFDRALGCLQASVGDAVATLQGALTSEPAPPPTRIRAAIALVDLALRATEAIETDARLRALEEAARDTSPTRAPTDWPFTLPPSNGTAAP